MNAPLVLTSVALLAGVAARPIDNDHRGGDLRELARSPQHDDQQAFLGRIPVGLDSLNSLQLHDIHDNTRPADDNGGTSTSPKLIGAQGLSEPDPGLDSPYMGPQRHLTNIEQELEAPSLLPTIPPADSSPTTSKIEKSQSTGGTTNPDYSPMVVPLVLASLAALMLLGLAVAVAYVTHLLRYTLLRSDVWRNVAKEKVGVPWSEKEKVDIVGRYREGHEGQGAIPAREVLNERVSATTLESTGPSDVSVADPELMPLPDNPPEISLSSAPTVHHQNHDRSLRLAFAAWTYDNWVTHFMMALFGWFGVFLGRANDRQ